MIPIQKCANPVLSDCNWPECLCAALTADKGSADAVLQPTPAYEDSTPHLNVGNSAFESWFQAQPFATQSGVKQISRDSYAAGMGDPLVCAKVQAAPIDMVLHCPACGLQHIDEPERSLGPGNTERLDWDNPPHRSHLCHGCGHIWRPADVPTNGVAAVATKGERDGPIGPSPLEAERKSRAMFIARLEDME